MKAYIKAVSYYLPVKKVTNADIVARFPEWSEDKISKKIGVQSRYVAADGETASDMAVKAALSMFDEYKVDASSIDFIMLCTQSPDYKLPTTACTIQQRLNIPTTAGAIDYNLGCSGYVYGLALAKGLVVAGIAKSVLLLTAETYSKYTHPNDKGNLSIFGDGASASLISTEGFAEIGEFSLGTDGTGANNLIVETGASRIPKSIEAECFDESGAIKSPDHLYMNGSEIFNFTLKAVPPLVQDAIAKNCIGATSEIDYIVFHQANKFMLDTLRKVCGFEKDKYYVNLSETGNTVSSTVPIALKEALKEEKIRGGMTVLIAGFGVGYSWGATTLKFTKDAL